MVLLCFSLATNKAEHSFIFSYVYFSSIASPVKCPIDYIFKIFFYCVFFMLLIFRTC